MSDVDPSKKEIIYFFCDCLTSFVGILEYVCEYIELHREDGEFDELIDKLHEFNDIYVEHIQEYEQELKKK